MAWDISHEIFVHSYNEFSEKVFELSARKQAVAIWADPEYHSPEKILNFFKSPRVRFGSDYVKKAGLAAAGLETFETQVSSQAQKNKVYLFPSSDTHVHMFTSLAKKFGDTAFFVVDREKRERAEETLGSLGYPFSFFSQIPKLFSMGPRVLLTGNDWGPIEKFRFVENSFCGGVNFCLQESIVDLKDRVRRMQWCDLPLLQGFVSAQLMGTTQFVFTGNPRYEHLRCLSEPDSTKPALINCNFTYGVHEGSRMSWVDASVKGVVQSGLDYLIVQHPRDRGDLSAYKVKGSNAGSIHSFINESFFVISRFSSVIHEAILLGRKAVYFNPHGEKLGYDFEPDNENLFYTESAEELVEISRKIKMNPKISPEFLNRYMVRHVGCTDGRASDRVVEATLGLSEFSAAFRKRNVGIKSVLRSWLQMRSYLSRRTKSLAPPSVKTPDPSKKTELFASGGQR